MAAAELTLDLPDLDADAPAGPNLEFDDAFGALERAAQGTPERQAGETIIPAEDPVWKDVAAQAAALLQRTYDLRVLAHLAVSRLHVSGLPAYAAVLEAIAGQLQNRWAHVHPQLDPEDDNDPALRANALLPLQHPTRVLRVLRTLPLATSKRAGPVSWRTVAVALGAMEPATPQEKQTETEIRAAFADTPGPRVEALRDSVAQALRAVLAIGAAFDGNAGYGQGPDMMPLAKQLREMDRYIGMYYVAAPAEPDATAADAAEDDAARDGMDAAADMDAADEAQAGGRAAGGRAKAGRAGPPSAMALTGIATRAEALHLLDLVCRYYATYEPSSPLPLMLDRARRLADKGFLEILQDLAPDGVFQAQSIIQPRDAG